MFREFRPYSVYVEKEVLERKIREGFSEIAFSNDGSWSRERRERIARACVFYHPDGHLETYEYHEMIDSDVIRVVLPFEREFEDDKTPLKNFKMYKLKLGEKRKITEVLGNIIGWEFRG